MGESPRLFLQRGFHCEQVFRIELLTMLVWHEPEGITTAYSARKISKAPGARFDCRRIAQKAIVD